MSAHQAHDVSWSGSQWPAERILALQREVSQAANELAACPDDFINLLKRAVEITRERLGVERCSIWILEPENEILRGTWGTDIHGNTTDERDVMVPLSNVQQDLGCDIFNVEGWCINPRWEARTWINGKTVVEGPGWNTVTPIRGLGGRVGVMFQDAVISGSPLEPNQQDAVALWCSLLGHLMARRQAEARDRKIQKWQRGLVEAADELTNRCPDLLTLLRRGVELTREKLDVVRAGIYLLAPDGDRMNGTFGTDMEGNTTVEGSAHVLLSRLESIIGEAFFARHAWRNQAELKLRHWNGESFLVHDIVAWNTVIPVQGPAGGVGALFVDPGNSGQILDPLQQEMLVLYCSFLGSAISKRQAEDRQDRLLKGMECILAAADELARCSDVDTLLRRGVELARERLGVVRSAIYMVQEDPPNTLRGAFGTNNQGSTSDERKNVVKLAVTREELEEHYKGAAKRWSIRQPERLTWWEDGVYFEIGEGWVTDHFLITDGRIIGLLYVDPGASGLPPDPLQQELLSVYASLLSRFIERRRVEDTLRRADVERIDSLGILAGGIAHDFNNLLTAVIGHAEVAALPGCSADALPRHLANILHTALGGKSLASQLITFARGGEPVLRPMELDHFLDKTVAMAVGRAELAWEVHVDNDLLCVLADEAQLAQVVQNLAINATQHVSVGGHLDIFAKNCLEDAALPPGLAPGAYVELAFQDNGPGIPVKILSRVFDPYFTTRSDGTGLGLATCRSIIRRHGGEIFVESPRRGGALFRIYLPATDLKATPSGDAFEMVVSRLAGRVLVLEDEADLRELAVEILENQGMEVVSCATGEQAVEAWKTAKETGVTFDLGIFDLLIRGGMGGLESAQIILEMDPKAKLVVCSGYSGDPVLSDPAKYGFCCGVRKPYRINELMRVLRDTLP